MMKTVAAAAALLSLHRARRARLRKRRRMRAECSTARKPLEAAAEEEPWLRPLDALREGGVSPLSGGSVYKVPHLRHYNGGRAGAQVQNHCDELQNADACYNHYVTMDLVLKDVVRTPGHDSNYSLFLRAGPAEVLYMDPKDTAAAIVTCGGLCPGLNNVIRTLVRTLCLNYGVEKVYGVVGGFRGMTQEHLKPVMLTPESVRDIHHRGGSVLKSSRGGFDVELIIDFLRSRRISQLYIIGGDGTHRAANALFTRVSELKLDISIVGIPKTIDNDIALIDRSFGFATAVAEAVNAVNSASVEAACVEPAGIGIVKVMGRHSGFIAAHVALGSGDVDLCLVPEVPFALHGDAGIIPYLQQVIAKRGHAVVVVAEGAGEDLLGRATETDAGGNRKLPLIGPFLKQQIGDGFAADGKEVTVKYINPSYMIRSVPACAADSMYCMLLAQNAVHGAMAGYTGFSVGLCNNRVVLLPITALVEASPRTLRPRGRTWERVIMMTGQPKV